MPYFVAALPILAFIGIVGAGVALLRGRRLSALVFGLVGLNSVLLAIALYYTSV